MDNRNGGPFALGRFWGYRTSVVGAAYDLCYDGWTAQQREEVENYLDWILYKCLHRQHRVGTVNWQPGSNYTVVIHAGNGMPRWPSWVKKAPRLSSRCRRGRGPAHRPASRFHAAPRGYPRRPVVKFDVGKFPTEWLWIGPFRQHVVQHEHPCFDYNNRSIAWRRWAAWRSHNPARTKRSVQGSDAPLGAAEHQRPIQTSSRANSQHTGKTIIKCYKLANNRENQHLVLLRRAGKRQARLVPVRRQFL